MLQDLEARRNKPSTQKPPANKSKQNQQPTTNLSYPHTLLETLTSLAASNQEIDAGKAPFYGLYLDINQCLEARKTDPSWVISAAAISTFPLIFRSFCRSFREREKSRSDLYSQVSFLLFAELSKLLSSGSDRSLALRLSILRDLLVVLFEQEVYRPANSDRAKQQKSQLVAIFELLKSTASDAQHGTALHSTIFAAWSALLRLDFAIVADNIETVWQFILTPDAQAKDSAVDLAIELLAVFVRSRELDNLLLSALVTAREDPWRSKLASASILDIRWKQAFANTISTMLPTQSLSAIKMIQTELFESYGPTSVSPSESVTAPTKKRKTESGSQPVDALSDSQLAIELLCICLANAFPTDAQQSTVATLLNSLYDDYIEPCINLIKDAASQDSLDQLVGRRLCPALNLHCTLIRISHGYWSEKVTTKSVQKLHKRLVPLNASNAHVQPLAVSP
eukprot:jgi/Hompol1/2885/HPOL_006212-RA